MKTFVGRKAAGVCLAAWVCLTASAQDFTNLDFEEVTLIGYTASLPGWGSFPTNAFALSGPTISLIDSNVVYGWNGVNYSVPHGKYAMLLEAGSVPIDPYFNWKHVAVSIAQTGTVTATAQSLTCYTSPLTDLARFEVTFNGTPLPLAVRAATTNRFLVGADISAFAGQTGELRFCATTSVLQDGSWWQNWVLLDYIRFSSTALSAAPVILTPPQSTSVARTGSTTFTVLASGYPTPAYQWFFQGTNAMAGGTAQTLTLIDAQPSQTGPYTVVLSNVYGAVTSTPALLTVLDPGILSQPSSRTAEIGSTAGFRLTAVGSDLLCQWYFKSQPIGSASTNLVLRLFDVQPTNAGRYMAVVSNALGCVTSSVVELGVIPPVQRRQVPAVGLQGQAGTSPYLLYAEAVDAGWLLLAPVTLAATQQFYADLSAPLPPQRIFRTAQGFPGQPPRLQMNLATEITLTGAIGSQVRVDCINQFGPTNAWTTLNTVILTNTAQPYFDFGSYQMPARLYRVVAIP